MKRVVTITIIVILILILILTIYYINSITRESTESSSTIIYLIYSNEDISQFKHPNIIPVRLEKQTVFLESEAFRQIGKLPYYKNIGFITVSFYKNQDLSLNELFEKIGKRTLPYTLGLVEDENRRLAFLTKLNGENFIKVWRWLITELGYSNYSHEDFKGISANMWVANRKFTKRYIKIAKRAMKICENAPPEIKKLLYKGPNFNESNKRLCFEKNGTPNYPFHPFFLENLVGFLTHLQIKGVKI